MARRGPRIRLDTREMDELGRDLLRRSAGYPAVRRLFLRRVGEKAMSLVRTRYERHVGLGLRFPAYYRGEYGSGLRFTLNMGAKRSFATLSNVAPHANQVDRGASPSEVDYEAVEAWAQEKLGLDPVEDAGDIKRILNKIRRVGTTRHEIIIGALAKGTSGGSQFDQFIEAEALRLLNEYFPRDSAGRRRARR